MSTLDQPSNTTGVIVGSLVLGAISTFGDWLWTHYIPDGAVVPGVLHGVVIFLVLGVVLAWATGQTGEARRRAYRLLLLSLPLAGAAIAAVFYPLAMVLGYMGSLLVTWALMWLTLSWLNRKARGDLEDLGRTALRAALAAIFSGLAFWSISGIWTQASPGGPNYLWHFTAWSFAFLPGFLALLIAQPR